VSGGYNNRRRSTRHAFVPPPHSKLSRPKAGTYDYVRPKVCRDIGREGVSRMWYLVSREGAAWMGRTNRWRGGAVPLTSRKARGAKKPGSGRPSFVSRVWYLVSRRGEGQDGEQGGVRGRRQGAGRRLQAVGSGKNGLKTRHSKLKTLAAEGRDPLTIQRLLDRLSPRPHARHRAQKGCT